MGILVLHGPNLNLLSVREHGADGITNLPRIDAELKQMAANAGAVLHSFQSNHEAALIDRIHSAGGDGTDPILINPGDLAHTSVVQHVLSLRTSAAA